MEKVMTDIGYHRQNNWIERLVLSKLFWLGLIGFFFAYPMLKSIQRELPAELPILSTLPEFNLTDENGRSYGTEDLRGKVYIANFMFTTCTTSCPTLLKEVQMVQHRMRGVIDRAAIVSISVDPTVDTPEVLYQVARERKANPNVWRFLTGDSAVIKTLLVDGFKVPMGDKEIADNVMDVAHSNKLVLVDQEGRIRGYYSADKDGVNQLMIDSGLLINRKKNS
ncbi:MAG: SCO family protein [Bacteriovoracia bacterium]